MLGLRALRDEQLAASLRARDRSGELEALLDLDARRRALLAELEVLRAERRRLSREAAGLPPGHPDLAPLAARVRATAARRWQLARAGRQVEADLRDRLTQCPNLLDPSVPPVDKVVAEEGQPPPAGCRPAPAVLRGLGEPGVQDYWGPAARLAWAVLDFALDFHVRRHGYRGYCPGPGETADARFPAEPPPELPLRYCTVTWGRDPDLPETPGPAVTMVRLVPPEESERHLEELVEEARRLLRELSLPHRVVMLAAPRLGPAPAIGYALETRLPGSGGWVAVAAACHHRDYLARRYGIRLRPPGARRARHAHTLVATAPRLHPAVTALLEHGAEEDGSVRLPPALACRLGQVYLEPRERIRVDSP